MTDTRVATLIVEVEGRSTNLEQLLQRVHADLLKTRTEADKTGAGVERLGGRQRKAGTDTLAHAQALARLAQAEGDTAAAVSILSSALQTQEQRTLQVINAETQLANTKRRLARETSGAQSAFQSLSSTASGLGAALGAAGFAFGAQQIAAFAVAAGQQANELEKIEATLKVTTGSQSRYNEVMAIAEGNQRLFGGTLAGNLAPLSAFVQLSARSGAELANLNSAAQLLLASNPAAAISDASFALSEFLSANGAEAALSLADRFNLDKAALTQLAAAGTTAEQRLAGLEQLLADQGITAEALAARLDTNAAAYDRLGAAASNAYDRLGAAASAAAAPAANAGAKFLEQLTALLSGQSTEFDKTAAAAAVAATSYADYAASVDAAGTSLVTMTNEQQLAANAQGPIVGGLQAIANLVTLLAGDTGKLTETQLAYVQALAAQGVAAEDAVAQAQAQAEGLGQIQYAMVEAQGALDGYAGRIATAAAASDQSRATMVGLADALRAGRTDIDGFVAGLIAVETANRAAADAAAAQAQAETDSAAAAQAGADASYADAAAKIEQATQAELASLRHDELDAAIRAAAAAGGDATAAAARIAAQFSGVEAPAVVQLINLHRELAAARANAAAPPRQNNVPAYLRPGYGGGAPADVARSEAATKASADARRAQLLATGSAAQIATLRQTEYNQAVKLYGAASSQAIEAQTALIQANERAAAAAAKGAGGAKGGGGGGGKSAATKAAEKEAKDVAKLQEQQLEDESRFQEQRLRDQEKIAAELEEAARDHAERMLDIEREYQERSREQEQKNEISKRRTKQNFYEALTSSDLGQKEQQALSAEYEAANARAEELAQSGRQAQADEYRRLKAEQLKAELEYQEAVKQAREDGNKAEVQRLEAMAQLRRDADQAELNELEQRGDSNVSQRDQATADEATRYAEEQAEIAGSAEEAAQRKIEASRLSGEALAAETLKIREQADALKALNDQRIAAGVPTTGAGTSTGADTATGAGAPPAAPVDPASIAAAGEAAGEAAGLLIATGQAQLADLLSRVISELQGVRGEIGRARGQTPFTGQR